MRRRRPVLLNAILWEMPLCIWHSAVLRQRQDRGRRHYVFDGALWRSKLRGSGLVREKVITSDKYSSTEIQYSLTSPLPQNRVYSISYRLFDKRQRVSQVPLTFSDHTRKWLTSICNCPPRRASSTLEAAVSSLASAVCSDTSRTLTMLRLISSATELCCSAAAAICWFMA